MARKLETKIPKSKRSKESNRLFQLRKRMGWTQKQTGEQFGVETDTIVKWEMGTRSMRGPALKLLAIFEEQAKKEK